MTKRRKCSISAQQWQAALELWRGMVAKHGNGATLQTMRRGNPEDGYVLVWCQLRAPDGRVTCCRRIGTWADDDELARRVAELLLAKARIMADPGAYSPSPRPATRTKSRSAPRAARAPRPAVPDSELDSRIDAFWEREKDPSYYTRSHTPTPQSALRQLSPTRGRR